MDTEPDDRSRTSRRQAERDLLDERRALLDALAALPPEAWDALPVDDELRTAIAQLAEMKADGARRRVIRHFARRTPEHVWPDLQAAYEALSEMAPEDIVTPADEAAQAWAERLIAEGDAALSDFLDRYWELDRNHLRRLLRNAMNREGGAADRARGALVAEIKTIRAAHDED